MRASLLSFNIKEYDKLTEKYEMAFEVKVCNNTEITKELNDLSGFYEGGVMLVGYEEQTCEFSSKNQQCIKGRCPFYK